MFLLYNHFSVFSEVFPRGFAEEFSMVCTFRTRKPSKEAWRLLSAWNRESQLQLAFTMDPGNKAIELSFSDEDNVLHTTTFKKPPVRSIAYGKTQNKESCMFKFIGV